MKRLKFSTLLAAALLAALTLAANAAPEASSQSATTGNEAKATFPLQIAPLELPSAPGAMAPALVTAPDGTVWLSWVEPAAGGGHALRFATLTAAAPRWSAPRTIASGTDWFLNWADFPSLTVGSDGHATVVWFRTPPAAPAAHAAPAAGEHHHHEGGYIAMVSQTADGGATWSKPAPLSRESQSVEFVALAALADGRVLAAWLDGRGKLAGGKTQRLYARIVGGDETTAALPDTLVDDSVCDCCQTTLTAFPDGGALVAYRARREGEIRDIYNASFSGTEWSEPRILGDDDWHIAGCPVNGPRLASLGGRVSAAWYTAADNEPRVLTALSPDAGARFTQGLRVDLGHPLGRVDTLALRDGSRLVTWLESTGGAEGKQAGIYLRRVAPSDALNEPALLAAASTAKAGGFPRIALVRDYEGTAPAQLVVAYTREGEPSALQTSLVTLPDLSTLAGRTPCAKCDEEDAKAARGFPLRGRVTGVLTDRSSLLVQHSEIPGVMRAMTMAFRVDAATLATAREGQELLGSIERRGREWWLFNVKLLGTPPEMQKK